MKENAFLSATLLDLLRLRATSQAEEIAYHFLRDDGSRETITYAELDLRARSIAASLKDDMPAGHRVVLLYPAGLEYIAGFFACVYAGAVAVPAFPPRPRRPMSGLKAILQDAAAGTVLTTSSVMARLAERVRGDVDLSGLNWIASDSIPAAAGDNWSRPDVTTDTLAVLQYTSGSTGSPKGVMVTHGNLIHNLAAIESGFGIEVENGVGVTWLPMYHDMGLVGGILEPMFVGRPAVLFPPVSFLQRPLFWLETITEFRGTISGGPNFAYQLCIDRTTAAQREKLDLSSWRTAYCGAEPIRWETLQRFAELFEPCGFKMDAFYPCYGLAESTLIVSGGNADAVAKVIEVDKSKLAENVIQLVPGPHTTSTTSLVACGRALMGQQAVIANPATGTQLDDWHIGEIWVRGPSVANGYWGRETLTSETFHAKLAGQADTSYLRTGDLGFLHDGELFVTGRLKDLIIIRGRNHYPQDIEQTVENCHEALRTNACTAFSVDVEGESQLVVVQEIERGNRKQDFDSVLDTIRQKVVLEHDIEPYEIVIVETMSLPKTSSGKGQRHGCRQIYLAGELAVIAQWSRAATRATPSEQATTSCKPAASISKEQIQQWLVVEVADRLGWQHDKIDTKRPYESFGLDSMAVVQLCADLETWLGRRVSPALLYEFSNIESLSAHLAAEPDVGTVSTTGTPQAFAEPIAIVGLGCRFPGGANDPNSYWRLLINGEDAVREVPTDRWDIDAYYDPNPDTPGKMSTRWGGFLDDVDRFDAQFFGITPREAQSLDPQQRMLLEVTWEALEHAGLSPDRLAGTPTGVFTGICNSDYSRLLQDEAESIDAYTGTGCAFSVTAGRVSYLLGLQGPSLPIDTACSSSLVAVHLACQSLLRDECQVALAAGVNLMLSPDATIYFSKVRAMAADGRCKAFDASADGYVRGEGCGVVVLKRLSSAVADGDQILAVVRGSAINHDGSSNGLTAPNPAAQRDVIRQALAVAGVKAADVSYVETHGTGTALGDPIEVQALGAALTSEIVRHQDLMIGSVKTNIGHLEAAAGIAGLIKTVLAMQHREIPPLLHLQQINPEISVTEASISIPTCRTPWTSSRSRRIAGVSSFGFSGTNAHVVLEEAPRFKRGDIETDRSKHLFTVSAKSAAALRKLVIAYQKRFSAQPDLRLADVCYTAGIGRSHFEHRLAVVVASMEELQERLLAFAAGQQDESIHIGRASRNGSNSIGTLCRPAADEQTPLELLAQQYVSGADLDWQKIDHGLPRRRVGLPTYPFQRKRYWMKPAVLGNGAGPARAATGTCQQADQSRRDVVAGPEHDAALAKQIVEASSGLRPGLMLVYLRRQFARAMDIDELEVSVHDNFLELGLDSLMAMDVIDNFKTDFDFKLHPREVYERPTIAALAEYLAGEIDPTAEHVTNTSSRRTQDPPHLVTLLSHRPSAKPALTGPGIENSVFVLSAPRSGSTLLRVMMAGHPQMFSPPELHLLPFDTMAQRRDVLGTSHLGEGLTRALMELEGIDAAAATRQVERWVKDDQPIDKVYRILADLAAPCRLVDKSPTTTASLETLQRAEAWFTKPKYVFLRRHPLAVIDSIVRMRFDKLVGGVDNDRHQWAEQIWRNANKNVLRFFDGIEPGRRVVLDFETLVTSPDEQLRRLATFLDVPYDTGMLNPYSGGRMTDGITVDARPIDDPNFLDHDGIDASLATAWQDIQLPRPLAAETIELAAQLGYETSGLTARSKGASNGQTTKTVHSLAEPQRQTPKDSEQNGSAMREDWINSDQLALCRCSWGPADGPTIVCLHGILDQGAVWKSVAEPLSERGYHVMAPDFRGHGRSSHIGPGCAYHLLDFVSDADAILRSLGDEQVVLVGHSLGALAAAQLALARPNRIARLFLIEPPLWDSAALTPQQRLIAYLDYSVAETVDPIMKSVDEAAARLRRAVPSLSDRFAILLAERVTRKTDDGWTWRWDPRLSTRKGISLADESFTADYFMSLIDELPMPVNVFLGAQSDRARLRRVQLGSLAKVECLTINGGHHLTIEAADEVASLIAQIVARHSVS